MWLAETPFKAIVSKVRKKMFEKYPELKEPISRDKRKIEYKSESYLRYREKCDSMQTYITSDILFRVNKEKIFYLVTSFLSKEQKESLLSFVKDAILEKKKDGIICLLDGERIWRGVSEKSQHALDLVIKQPIFSLFYDGEIRYKGENPGYTFRLCIENGELHIYEPDHHKDRLMYVLKNKQDVDEFIVENAYRNYQCEMAKIEVKEFLEKVLKLDSKYDGTWYKLCGKDEFVYFSRNIDYTSGKEMFLSSVVGEFIHHENIKELISMVKDKYRSYFYENRLVFLTGLLKDNAS
jgi:hypothetical protein